MTENEYTALMEKYDKRTLNINEKELAKQAPSLVKKMQKSGIDFSDDNWFGNRLYSKGEDAVTPLDLDIYHSHIPEYYKLAESL